LKNTVFSIELELKLLALIVIVLPIPPNAGSIESIIGWGKINDIKNINKEKSLPLQSSLDNKNN